MRVGGGYFYCDCEKMMGKIERVFPIVSPHHTLLRKWGKIIIKFSPLSHEDGVGDKG